LGERRWVVGVDEAGYGPNLGPLVIGASVWSLPAEMPTAQLWQALSAVLTDQPVRQDHRLHVADSKQVYQSQKGLAALERGVLSLWQALQREEVSGSLVSAFPELMFQATAGEPECWGGQPWAKENSLTLPLACASLAEPLTMAKKIGEHCDKQDIRLERMAAAVVCPERFNQGLGECGNKSTLLSRATFGLVQRVWPEQGACVEVLADKHGGRNRYDHYLLEYFPEQFFLLEKESREESRYRCGEVTISLAMRSERHLPVAVASMLAKYLRELAMEQFNRFWQKQLPSLKPTKGYPQDARRFRLEVKEVLAQNPGWEELMWRVK